MAAQLDEGPRALLSTRSRRYRELRGELAGLDDEALLDVLAREPQLLRRPLLVRGREVVVGYDERDLERLAGGSSPT